MGTPLMSTCENEKNQLQVHVKRPVEKEKRKKKKKEWTMKIQTIAK